MIWSNKNIKKKKKEKFRNSFSKNLFPFYLFSFCVDVVYVCILNDDDTHTKIGDRETAIPLNHDPLVVIGVVPTLSIYVFAILYEK